MAKTARKQTKKKAERLEANRDRVAKGLSGSSRARQDSFSACFVAVFLFCVVVCLFVFLVFALFLLSGGVFVTTTGLYTGPLPVHS